MHNREKWRRVQTTISFSNQFNQKKLYPTEFHTICKAIFLDFVTFIKLSEKIE